MNHDNPPLTVESVVDTLGDRYHFGIPNGDEHELVEALIAQQTAAKDARIAELEAERDALQAELAIRPFKLIPEDDGSYTVAQANHPHVASYGKDIIEAVENFADALACYEERETNASKEIIALQTNLDDAQAQVAILVEAISNLKLHTCGGDYCGGWVEVTVAGKEYYLEDFIQTQPTAEQWKADLLKPYQEAVKVLREALQRIAHEQTDSEYDPSCDEPHSSLLAFKALKDTEGLV